MFSSICISSLIFLFKFTIEMKTSKLVKYPLNVNDLLVAPYFMIFDSIILHLKPRLNSLLQNQWETHAHVDTYVYIHSPKTSIQRSTLLKLNCWVAKLPSENWSCSSAKVRKAQLTYKIVQFRNVNLWKSGLCDIEHKMSCYGHQCWVISLSC
jgi:hypothetical protein